MSEDSFEHENFLEALKATNRQFEAENDDLEAIIEGGIGFHAFFVADDDDPTRGAHTAVYQGIYDEIQEMHVDRDIVEHNHGEVTPETVRKETMNQLHEFTYLPENFIDAIGDRVERRVEKNLNGGVQG